MSEENILNTGDDLTPLGFLTLGEKYIKFAQVISQELVQSGNKWIVSSSTDISTEEYAEQTKWSDFEIAVPLLFNFYHGIELLCKGHLIGQGASSIHGHKLTELHRALSENNENNDFQKLLAPWINPPASNILAAFFKENAISIDDWYQALKYPKLSNGNKVTALSLKYKEKKSIDFWQSLCDACKEILAEAVSLSRHLGYA